MPRTLGAIVAGGRGSRLGLGMPKALARVGGSTLLERATAALDGCCDEVVVVLRRGMSPPIVRGRIVHDAPGAAGPLAGVVAALESCAFERAIVLGVDFPLVRPAALRGLLDRLAGHAAVVPSPGGIPQPLAAAYAPAATQALADRLRAGERSVTAAVLALEPLILDDDEIARLDGGSTNFFNLNTPADLAEAERLLAIEAPGSEPEGGANDRASSGAGAAS